MKTTLILMISNQKLLDITYNAAIRSKKYSRIAKYDKVAWAQLYNPEEDMQVKILCDSYLDYRVYNKLLGMTKYAVTHNMPIQIIVKDMQETYTFQPVCNRQYIGNAKRKVKYKDKQGRLNTIIKIVREETKLSSSAWAMVEAEISDLKRLFQINKRFTEEVKFKTEIAEALIQDATAFGLENVDIRQAWEYCNIYGPAYGLDPIYMPISRDSMPRNWILNRRNIQFDKIHDEKARLNRVLQTLPIEYEAQIRVQFEQIRWYQLHKIEWLPEFKACPECGHPVNTAADEPMCAYCSTEMPNILHDAGFKYTWQLDGILTDYDMKGATV